MRKLLKWSIAAVVVAAGLTFFGNGSAEAARRHAVVRHRGVYVAAPRVYVATPRVAVYYGGRGVNVRVGGIVDVQVGGRHGVYIGSPYRPYYVGHPYRPYVHYRGW